MRYRSANKLSFVARFTDNLILVIMLSAVFLIYENQQAKKTQALIQEEIAANEALVISQKKEVVKFLSQTIAIHEELITNLDSINQLNINNWNWRRMDFYGPLAFTEPMPVKIYPNIDELPDSIASPYAKSALNRDLPSEQFTILNWLDESPMWDARETKQNLRLLQVKIERLLSIEKTALSDLQAS